MGVLTQRTGSRCSNMRPRIVVFLLMLVLLLVFGVTTRGTALQKYTLGPEGGAATTAPAESEQKPAALPPATTAAPPPAGQPPHVPAAPSVQTPQQPPAHPEAGAGPPQQAEQHEAKPPAPAEHAGEAAEEHGEEGHGEGHAVKLPEISPIPGVTFVDTLIALMEQELQGRTLGWRPNDLIIGRFTDDINNYQLGVLEAVRFTALRLKDSLTRMGDADTYDPDLEQAVNLFMNSATLWWFPSAESSYGQAIEHLKKFRAKLEKGQRNFYYRRDNLVALLATYRDLLGNVNRSLIMPVGWFQSDDHFYYAKGVAHVYFEVLKVCRVGFKGPLASTMHAEDMMDEVLHELNRAEQIDPWIILNSGDSGFLANHRANLNAPLSEVAHLLVVLSQL